MSANGDLDSNGKVAVRWDAAAKATGYRLRYAEETCTDTPQETAAVCSPGDWKEENGIAAISKKLSAGSGRADLLTSSTVYRIQVQATNTTGASNWSDIAFVYPTSNAPKASRKPKLTAPYVHSKAPEVATNPLYGYQPANTQGVHEFSYIICDGTIPSGVNINATQIAAAIEKWEDAVKKDSSGKSMVQTTRTYHPTPAPLGACKPPRSALGGSLITVFPLGRNEVMFVGSFRIFAALCVDAKACWRSNTWDTTGTRAEFGLVGSLSSIAKGTMFLNASKGAVYWNAGAHNNACKRVEHTVVHEAGHALGIGWPINNHPRNPTLSVMSADYTHRTQYCEPQAYDIVAIMANYQSR